MQALFEEIRAACSPKTWSRGVELSRAGAVIGEQHDSEEIVLKVATQVGMAYATVRLWPQEVGWECDCKTPEEVCPHVAAAVIALRRAQQAGKTLPVPNLPPGRVGYRFTRVDRALVFERLVLHGAKTEVLQGALAGLAAGRAAGPAVIVTQADLAIERALGARLSGRLPRDVMPRLLRTLAQCPEVRLDTTPVKTSATPVLPQGRLIDQGEGFLLYIEPDPSITEVFTNGVVLCGDTLRPVGESGLTARERDELPQGRFFAPDDVAELVTAVLPALRQHLPVEVRTQRLPGTTAEPPRLVIDTQRDGATLVVLPALVYGTPPTARVEEGRLVALGQQTIPLRDEAAERQLVRQVKLALGLEPGRPQRFTGEDAVRFVRRLQTWHGEVHGDGPQAFRLAPSLVPRLHLEAERFEVYFETLGLATSRHASPTRLDAVAVLHAWQHGATFVPLTDGSGWAPLPVDWLERFGDRIADLLAARSATSTLPTCAVPDLARLCADLEQPPPPGLANLQALLADYAGLPGAILPEDVQATLRPYQRHGVNWLAFLGQTGLGALLADDMGLGKTLQALCTIHGRTLVVTPTSVLHNWAEEIRRFRPGLRYAIYHGAQRQLDSAADVILTTYAILRLDTATLAHEVWETVVLDEAQIIKNPDSQVARAAYRLQARRRLVLSGTPVENRLEELWSLMHFLNPGLLGGRQHFQERYARPITAGQAGAAARLRERLRPFILRRRKHEVATELPPRTDIVLHCLLTADEQRVYEAIRAATREQVVQRLATGGSVLEALEALLRLRQACCHSGLIPGQQAATSSKVMLLLETLEQVVAEGHKALVFSQWTTLLDRVEPHLRSAGLTFTRLDGSTRDRAAVVHRFQDPQGPPLLLISLRAGGLGLNLTAADHVFLLDPWWNPAVEDQAADRAHRLGQDRPVLVYHLVAEETVEERILALQAHKRALSEAALEGAERAAALTREDLLALLA
jgi:SNF2-related domain/Helicase conserved C-terminal domain